MTIGEIIEALKQGKALADIGKELAIGKEKLSKALREAGYSFSRRDGWMFIGTGEAPVNQDYTDFVKSSRTPVIPAQQEVVATIEKVEAPKNPISQLSDETGKKQENNPTIKQINKQVGKPIIKPSMKKVTYEIEEWLHDELKIRSIKDKRTVSEIVNEIIKKGIKQ